MSTTTTTPRPTRDGGGGPVSRVLRHPLTWMLVGVVGVGLVGGPTASAEPFLLLPVLGAALAVVVYRVVMRFVARRRTPEIAARRAVPEALLGAAVGLGFVAVSAAVVTALGGYTFRVADVDLLAVVAPILAVTVGAAVTEELTFRGFALQALERLLGSWTALAVTALFFGLTHLFNPGATAWSALAIAIEAGGLLGAAFLWRRNLWFVIGLHFAWNATAAREDEHGGGDQRAAVGRCSPPAAVARRLGSCPTPPSSTGPHAPAGRLDGGERTGRTPWTSRSRSRSPCSGSSRRCRRSASSSGTCRSGRRTRWP